MNTVQFILLCVGMVLIVFVGASLEKRKLITKKMKYIVFGIYIMSSSLVLLNSGVFGNQSLPEELGGSPKYKSGFEVKEEEVKAPVVSEVSKMGSKELEDSKKVLENTLK